MLASAWRLVGDTLRELSEAGVQDTTVKTYLGKDANIRAKYLVLYDIVNIVAQAGQSKFALLATTARKQSSFVPTVQKQTYSSCRISTLLPVL